MDYEIVHLLAISMLKNTEFYWQQYLNEVVIPDLKLIFFSGDYTSQLKDSYLNLKTRPNDGWLCIPLTFWDVLNIPGLCEDLNIDDNATSLNEQQLDKISEVTNDIESNIISYISCIISSVYTINFDNLYENDEDCDILQNKEALKNFIESCAESSDDEEDDEEWNQVAEFEPHKDLIEMAMALNCSCKALDEAIVKYGFYDDGTYEAITATIPVDEFINSRKKAYFVNTGDISPLITEDIKDKLSNIKVDKDYNIIK